MVIPNSSPPYLKRSTDAHVARTTAVQGMAPPPLSAAARKADQAVARLEKLQLLLHETTAPCATIAKQQSCSRQRSSVAATFAEDSDNRRRQKLPPPTAPLPRVDRMMNRQKQRISDPRFHSLHNGTAAHDRLQQKKSSHLSAGNVMDLHRASVSSSSSPQQEADNSPLLPSSIASSTSPSRTSSAEQVRRRGRIASSHYHQKTTAKLEEDTASAAASKKPSMNKKMLSVQSCHRNPNRPWHFSASSSTSPTATKSSSSMTTTMTSSSSSTDSNMVLGSVQNVHHSGGFHSSITRTASSLSNSSADPDSTAAKSSLSRRFSLTIPTVRSFYFSAAALEAETKHTTPSAPPSPSTSKSSRRFSLPIPMARSFHSSAALEAQRTHKNEAPSALSLPSTQYDVKLEQAMTDNRRSRKPRLWLPSSLQAEAKRYADAMLDSSRLLPLRHGTTDNAIAGKKTYSSSRGKENCCALLPMMGCVGLSRTKSISLPDTPYSAAAGQYMKNGADHSKSHLHYSVDSPLQNQDLQKSKQIYFV